jgi:acyl carrier protein
MRDKIKNVMALVFEMEPYQIPDSASTSTIDNWDSLNHMNLIVALEEEFNILFNDEEIVEIISLEAVEKTLLSKM